VNWWDHPLVLPTDLFAYIFDNFRDKFETSLSGKQQVLHKFWSAHNPNDPKLHNHPIKAVANWMWTSIPLAIFGDAAPYAKSSKESVLVPIQMSEIPITINRLGTLRKLCNAKAKEQSNKLFKLARKQLLCLDEGLEFDRPTQSMPCLAWAKYGIPAFCCSALSRVAYAPQRYSL